MAKGMREMFEPFERIAREHHLCPCCERTFSAEEEDNFVKKVKKFPPVDLSFQFILFYAFEITVSSFDYVKKFQRQQRVKASTTGEQAKVLAAESSNADSIFQQLDKLRSVFEEYSKLTNEIIPEAEKSLQEYTEEFEQKSEALDDVSWGALEISLDITDLHRQVN